MKGDSQLEQAIHTVDTASDLRIYLTAPSQATMMPFAKEPGKKYVVLVLFLIEAALNLETLSFICSRSIKYLADGGILANLDGVEIMPCVVRGDRTKRVLRLSVLSKALDKATNLTTSDLRSANPYEGITSHFYLNEITSIP